MEKLFGKMKMSWGRVILFAVFAGVYTGLTMLVPQLENTSFQDIGILYEWWVVFAVIVVTNCEKSWEAALKCFVFFLVSQPLVYAVEILFGKLTLYMGFYYYKSIWLKATALTLPGGFVAYFCKKQNPVGGVILGLGNTILAFLGVNYMSYACTDFPHHLLSSIFCFASVIIMSLSIQKKWYNRLIAVLLPLILAAAVVLWAIINHRALFQWQI